MTETVANDGLATWISGIRSQPAEAPPLDVEKLRSARVRPAGPALPMVLDVLVPGDIPVQVRFYRPHERPLPLIVYLHDGSFIFGDLDTHDRHDLLRDEGEALAQRLLDAGTNVLHVRHPGLVHGFLSLDIVSPAALDAGNNLLRQFGSVIRDVAG